MELFVIVNMLLLYEERYKNKYISIYCDNKSAVSYLITIRVSFDAENSLGTQNLIIHAALDSIKYNILH